MRGFELIDMFIIFNFLLQFIEWNIRIKRPNCKFKKAKTLGVKYFFKLFLFFATLKLSEILTGSVWLVHGAFDAQFIKSVCCVASEINSFDVFFASKFSIEIPYY